jgi:enamine deaminase RidA (YjgF/YER057c/UK114 family)
VKHDDDQGRGGQGHAHDKSSMQHKIINPWTWQDQFGFVQGNEIENARRMLICSGQTSNDENGNPLHPGDMAAQIQAAFDNLETVLDAAGFELKDVMRLVYYTTDVDLLLANYGVVVGRLQARGARPASTLLGVTRLAFPQWLIEMEATAVK